MSFSSKAKKTVVGASVVLGSLGIGAGSVAWLNAGSASAATTTSPSTNTKAGHLGLGLLRRSVDGTISVKTKTGYVTAHFARGTVGAISSTSITVNSPDNTSLTGTINGTTKYHGTAAGQITQNEKAGLVVVNGVARLIAVPSSSSSS
jgi:hypothetical protein